MKDSTSAPPLPKKLGTNKMARRGRLACSQCDRQSQNLGTKNAKEKMMRDILDASIEGETV
jgi:hypothetical protein